MPEANQKFQKRQTAYKVRIQDVLDSEYIKTEGFSPNYLNINNQEISRINVVGIVLQKSEISNYKTLTMDDGTGKIFARIFEDSGSLEQINVGDIVLIIGRPREFSSEKYILIEIIKKVNPIWAKVRKLELEKEIGYEGTQSNEEKILDLNPSNKIFSMIKKLDKGNGVSIEDISTDNIKNVDKIIDTLLKGGDIFEVSPGKLKVLE
jgi:RPA family protein